MILDGLQSIIDMSNHDVSNKRILKNTIFLYVRMIILLIVSLYTSRIVLDKLGVEDFGIYNVVAGFVMMLVFFRSSLSNVTQRFLNIELGKGDYKRAQQIFCQHFLLYLCIIAVFLIIGETVGLYFVSHKLVIPSERLDAAIMAYHFALVSVCFTLFGIVFDSAIIAHEDMKVYSVIGVIEGLAKLAVAFAISIVAYDRLVTYALLLMMLVAFVQLYYCCYCQRRYEECRFVLFWDRKTLHQIFPFMGWNFVGTIIYMLKDQGLNILMNIFFGPTVNAARAVSYQINGAIVNCNSNFVTSVQPQIVKSYASGDISYLNTLFFKSTKYSLLLMWVLCLPVMLYMSELLSLWLKVVPNDTAIFTIWVLIDSILATMTNAPWIITMATGKLRRYVLHSNMVLIMIFPLAYIAFKLGAPPLAAFVIIVIVRVLQLAAILIEVNSQIHFGLNNYFKSIIAPVLMVIALSLPICLALRLFVLPSCGLFSLAGVAVLFLIALIFVWFAGTTLDEKTKFVAIIKSRIKL